MSDGFKPPVDPTVAYSAVRAHELVLNEAAAALERAVVPPLLTLNGGAAAAFLTLLGALGKDSDLGANIWWAGGAVVVWLTGLVFAAFAYRAAKYQQTQVNKGYRLMRELLESEVFGPDVADLIAAPPEENSKPKKDQRKDADTSADKAKDEFQRWWQFSVLCFAAGGLLALFAVFTG